MSSSVLVHPPGPAAPLAGAKWRSSLAAWLPLLIAFLPAGWLCGLVVKYWVNIPYSDEWTTSLGVPLAKWREGTLQPGDLWAQHTESRPVFPRLAALALVGRAGEWDVRGGMVIGLLAAAGISLLLYSLLGRGARTPGPWGRGATLAAMNVLLFSPVGWEIWLWGEGAMVLLPLLCLLAALRVNLSQTFGLRTRALINAALAFVGTFTFSSGLLLWPLAWPLPCSGERGGKKAPAAIYGLAAAASLAFYFHGFQSSDPQAFPYALTHPGEAMLYLLTWCSVPLLPMKPPGLAHAALGGMLILAWAALAGRLWVDSRNDAGARRAGYPWIMLGLWTLGLGALAALGRTQGGLEFALSSRYAVSAVHLPVAILGMGFVRWRFSTSLPRPEESPAFASLRQGRRDAVVAGLVLSTQLAGWLHIRACGHAVMDMRDMREARELARDALRFIDLAPENFQLRAVFPNPGLPEAFHRLHAAGLVRVRLAAAEPLSTAVAAAPSAADQGASGSFDACAPVIGEQLAVSGWASDPAAEPGQRSAPFVLFTFMQLDASGRTNGRARPFTVLRTERRRPDVASVLREPAMEPSGFSYAISRPLLPPATVRIAAWAVNPATGQARQLSHYFDIPPSSGR